MIGIWERTNCGSVHVLATERCSYWSLWKIRSMSSFKMQKLIDIFGELSRYHKCMITHLYGTSFFLFWQNTVLFWLLAFASWNKNEELISAYKSSMRTFIYENKQQFSILKLNIQIVLEIECLITFTQLCITLVSALVFHFIYLFTSKTICFSLFTFSLMTF